MKKIMVLAALGAGALFVIKRRKDAQAEADLWREATAPSTGALGGANVNGTASKASAETDGVRKN